MRKVYLFVYSNDLGTREIVKNTVDSIESIILWRYDLPNSFYLVSTSSAIELSEKIRMKLGDKRFIITEISSNKQGWLPKKSWHLINHKKKMD